MIPNGGRMSRIIVKYYGDIESILSEYPYTRVSILFNQFAIVDIPENYIDELLGKDGIEYIERSRDLYFNVNTGRGVSCINSVQVQNSIDGLNLTGKGVLVGIIDSGIDYLHPDFIDSDGKTRIRFLWDQTADLEASSGRVPAGYSQGAEYDSIDINNALEAGDAAASLQIVPVRDRGSGHGTAVAGIAAGNGRGSVNMRYKGVAPESELIIVKLGNAGEGFARTTEVMEGIDYVIRKSIELNMPVAVNLSFGTNDGPHDGNSLFEDYISEINGIGRNVVVVASGNEGDARHHAFVDFGDPETIERIRLGIDSDFEAAIITVAIAENEREINMQAWKSYQDDIDIEILSPDGGRVLVDKRPLSTQDYVIGGSRLRVLYGEPTPYTITQGINIQWLPINDESFIKSGLWTIRLIPRKISYGKIDLWLPTTEVVGLSTGFLRPDANITLTIPSAARNVITVGAYDAVKDAYAPFSGRGNTTDRRYMPTLVAPGVGVVTSSPGGGYRARTGTSMAAPFVTGSAALLMQWGITDGNDPYLYGQKVKAYLIKGARQLPGEETPSTRTGWGALCVRDSLPEI